MNRRRGEHGNAVVDGKIYVIGGISQAIDGPDEIEQFDPHTNQWIDLGTMPLLPTNRSRHHITIGSAVHGKEIWVVGGKWGNDNTGTNFVDVYDTAAQQWRLGPDLPEEMWGGPSIIVGDTLHAFAGAQGRTATQAFHFSLDLTKLDATWQIEPEVPNPRVHLAGATVDNKIYLIGGELHHSHDGDTTTVQVYDTVTQTWDFGADLPLPRSHAEWATFSHAGEIWSVSGVDSSNAPNRGQSEIFIYNPDDDRWRQFEKNLPGNLVSPGAKIIDNRLYVFGGGVNDWFEGDMRTTHVLSLAATQEGDFNLDGVIDSEDFLMWQRGDSFSPASASELAYWKASFGTEAERSVGEFNGDGVVDGDDFLMWQRGELSDSPSMLDLEGWKTNFGMSQFRPQVMGEFNGDGVVDGVDLLVWQRGQLSDSPNSLDLKSWKTNFGNSNSQPQITKAVPEPASWFLLVLCALALRRIRVPSTAEFPNQAGAVRFFPSSTSNAC